jgi:putative endonuclease
MGQRYFVYFMASNNRSALYVGVTSNILQRVQQHKDHAVDGYTKKYNCVNLVYFEEAPNIEDAIMREKQLKKMGKVKERSLGQ